MAKVETKEILWNAPENIKAYITTRIGGYSKDRYASSNMSLDVGDLKSSVVKNREINSSQFFKKYIFILIL